IERQFAAQIGAKFTVTDEIEGLCVFGQAAFDKVSDFIEPTGVQHLLSTLVDSLVERFSRGLQTDFENPPAGKRRSPSAVHLRNTLSRQETYLDRADKFLLVSHRDLFSRLRIKMLKHFV